MIVLHKKRIMLTIYLVLISVFASVYTISQNERNTDAVLVSALPVSEKVIVIDARTWNTR